MIKFIEVKTNLGKKYINIEAIESFCQNGTSNKSKIRTSSSVEYEVEIDIDALKAEIIRVIGNTSIILDRIATR